MLRERRVPNELDAIAGDFERMSLLADKHRRTLEARGLLNARDQRLLWTLVELANDLGDRVRGKR